MDSGFIFKKVDLEILCLLCHMVATSWSRRTKALVRRDLYL